MKLWSPAVSMSPAPLALTFSAATVGRRRGYALVANHALGEAPSLVLHELPFVVRKTRTTHYRDANVARMPRYPFEPMFQSMSVMNPEARFDHVDIIINRNSLTHLLRFANGTGQKAFRLDLAMVHNTLVVTPVWEKITEAKRHKTNYGREFEDLFVRRRPDMQDSSTHHRAIRYSMGSLSCAVLLEIDATVDRFDELKSSPLHKHWRFLSQPRSLSHQELSEEGLPRTDAEASLFGSLDTANLQVPRPKHCPHSMVIPRGRGTLSSTAAELVMTKGRAAKKNRQLWLGRTPYCVRGSHMDANFTRVDVIYYGTSFRAFEIENQDGLQRLVSLIKQLRQFAINATDQSCIVIYNKAVRPFALRVFEHEKTPRPPLPEDLRSHFWTEARAET
ncbi:hypothetical protein VMCG_08773 [Cytospora schulzeri]|uniref:Uncharacterized protein n=1 Tax=Cytospora schulzeri TaxID=448051 RepID=A0A423VS93_9PEZI|nr:hypothetical protein VMCG_08773 [Valsa malicola]